MCEKIRINFQIPADLAQEGKEAARKQSISFSALIRQSLMERIRREDTLEGKLKQLGVTIIYDG